MHLAPLAWCLGLPWDFRRKDAAASYQSQGPEQSLRATPCFRTWKTQAQGIPAHGEGAEARPLAPPCGGPHALKKGSASPGPGLLPPVFTASWGCVWVSRLSPAQGPHPRPRLCCPQPTSAADPPSPVPHSPHWGTESARGSASPAKVGQSVCLFPQTEELPGGTGT